MAAREFHGIIRNEWQEPLNWVDDKCDSGIWTSDWYPSKPTGSRIIAPNEQKEWRSESDGIMTGTSGWALWSVLVFDHAEFVQVNWSVPFYGTPNITCGVFRSDPRDPFRDPNPPQLEILPVSINEDGNQSALGQAATIAPYVLTIPVSFFTNPTFRTHPSVTFALRSRTVASPLTFPNTYPSAESMAIQAFINRSNYAAELGFVGAFPNFYEAVHGLDHVGGTILIKPGWGEWCDVPLAALGNPPLDDFGERMRKTNAYASQNGYVGGFPTFYHADYGNGIVCGTVLLNSDQAEWRDVTLEELGNPPLNDIGARFRATQDYANSHGLVGGFPNMYHAEKMIFPMEINQHPHKATVCGTVLLKPNAAEWRDLFLFRDPA